MRFNENIKVSYNNMTKSLFQIIEIRFVHSISITDFLITLHLPNFYILFHYLLLNELNEAFKRASRRVTNEPV